MVPRFDTSAVIEVEMEIFHKSPNIRTVTMREKEKEPCLTNLRIIILTYLFTPWSRVRFEKLKVFKLVKKFPGFYGIRKFITGVTSSRHLSLTLASSIQSTPHVTSE
jgi:hypothetical protein